MQFDSTESKNLFSIYTIDKLIQKYLYDQDAGYYQQKINIGFDKSDFFTAVELGPLFNHLVSAFLYSFFASEVQSFNICELGPGNGTFAKSLLDFYTKTNLIDKIDTYHLVEISTRLASHQQQKINHRKISCISNVTQVKENTVFFGNEFLDATPIKQFQLRNNQWHEIYAKVKNNTADFFLATDSSDQVEQFITHYCAEEIFIENDIIEIPFVAIENFKMICQQIATNSLGGLFIDYGSTNITHHDTLQGVVNHQKIEWFKHLGQCDITHQVQFSIFQQIASDYGLSSQIITQREFLLSCGIEQKYQQMIDANPKLQLKMDYIFNILINKEKMGEIFKIMIVKK